MPSYGDGGGDVERRILNLEGKVYNPEIADLQRRMTAAEQRQFLGSGGGSGGGDSFTLGVTSGAIAAGTATTPTSGTVTLRLFDGTTLSADTATVTGFNYHDKIIASGSLVALGYGLGAWWIIDVRSCTDLS